MNNDKSTVLKTSNNKLTIKKFHYKLLPLRNNRKGSEKTE